MAERLHKRHDEAARRVIKTRQILERLNLHALGENDPQSDKPVELSVTQIQAARILLAKALPDLRMIELGNSEDGPLKISIVRHADDRDTS